jgi:hypothetical protein
MTDTTENDSVARLDKAIGLAIEALETSTAELVSAIPLPVPMLAWGALLLDMLHQAAAQGRRAEAREFLQLFLSDAVEVVKKGSQRRH